MTRVSLFLASAFCLVPFAVSGSQAQTPRYDVHAVRFAHVPYSLGSLVAGGDRATMVDIAFTVWVLRNPAAGKVVLVDAGFYRDKFVRQWKPRDFVTPAAALTASLGIKPEQVTDIILTHSHWDHADGADLFPRATVWLQRDEYAFYIGLAGEVLQRGGVDAEDALMLASLSAAGRVRLIDGDDREIIPGIRVYTGGKHTFGSQYVGVTTRAGVVVLASDNAYLYENLEKRVAIAQTLDAESNVAAQARMATIAASPRLIIPGHDPAVFERFPVVKPGVVRID